VSFSSAHLRVDEITVSAPCGRIDLEVWARYGLYDEVCHAKPTAPLSHFLQGRYDAADSTSAFGKSRSGWNRIAQSSLNVLPVLWRGKTRLRKSLVSLKEGNCPVRAADLLGDS
jgi:hypothetical protein